MSYCFKMVLSLFSLVPVLLYSSSTRTIQTILHTRTRKTSRTFRVLRCIPCIYTPIYIRVRLFPPSPIPTYMCLSYTLDGCQSVTIARVFPSKCCNVNELQVFFSAPTLALPLVLFPQPLPSPHFVFLRPLRWWCLQMVKNLMTEA